MKKEIIEEKLSKLEIQLECFDNIHVVQDTIHEISILMKGSKNRELQNKFNNLIKYFRKVYLSM